VLAEWAAAVGTGLQAYYCGEGAAGRGLRGAGAVCSSVEWAVVD